MIHQQFIICKNWEDRRKKKEKSLLKNKEQSLCKNKMFQQKVLLYFVFKPRRGKNAHAHFHGICPIVMQPNSAENNPDDQNEVVSCK